MNRHVRNIRRSATTRARDVWRWPDTVTWAGPVPAEGRGDFDCCARLDHAIAEAVAHEREAIARWLNTQSTARLDVSRGPGARANVSALIHEAGVALNSAAAAIRSGAHREDDRG